jgi:hypothetical protein
MKNYGQFINEFNMPFFRRGPKIKKLLGFFGKSINLKNVRGEEFEECEIKIDPIYEFGKKTFKVELNFSEDLMAAHREVDPYGEEEWYDETDRIPRAKITYNSPSTSLRNEQNDKPEMIHIESDDNIRVTNLETDRDGIKLITDMFNRIYNYEGEKKVWAEDNVRQLLLNGLNWKKRERNLYMKVMVDEEDYVPMDYQPGY